MIDRLRPIWDQIANAWSAVCRAEEGVRHASLGDTAEKELWAEHYQARERMNRALRPLMELVEELEAPPFTVRVCVTNDRGATVRIAGRPPHFMAGGTAATFKVRDPGDVRIEMHSAGTVDMAEIVEQ